MLDDLDLDRLAGGVCSDCGAVGLVPGPRGGLCRNEACPQCGAEFNIARHAGRVLLAQRNGTKGQPNRVRLAVVFGIDLPYGDGAEPKGAACAEKRGASRCD